MKLALTFAVVLVLAMCSASCTSKAPAPICATGVDAACPVPVAQAKGISTGKTVQLVLQNRTLISGVPADPSEWPASVYAMSGGSACSATIVGDRVLFMAAHCMKNGDAVSFTAHANSYQARCLHHPDYAKNPTADWALCLIDRPVTGIPFEVVGIDETLNFGGQLLLSGYGCIRPGGGGGNDGVFRTGTATIAGLPSSQSQNFDIVTKGGAALCFGDSGGSAYKRYPSGRRHVVGINSRGDIATTSYLSSVFAPSFISWAKAWAKESNNVMICGMHQAAEGCRSVEPGPSIDANGAFDLSSKAACLKGVIRQEYLDRKAEIVKALGKALEQF